MICLLYQHSLWSRKHFPFLLCRCHRCEGVLNDGHVCKLLTHEEHMQHYNTSEEHWHAKLRANQKLREKAKKVKEYNVKEHMDWVDKNTEGCSHFDIHPDLLRRDQTRFDIFYVNCSIIKKLMGYLHNYVLSHLKTIIEDFSKKVLKSCYNVYHLYCWNGKKILFIPR